LGWCSCHLRASTSSTGTETEFIEFRRCTAVLSIDLVRAVQLRVVLEFIEFRRCRSSRGQGDAVKQYQNRPLPRAGTATFAKSGGAPATIPAPHTARLRYPPTQPVYRGGLACATAREELVLHCSVAADWLAALTGCTGLPRRAQWLRSPVSRPWSQPLWR
jgi:hypothetical protein